MNVMDKMTAEEKRIFQYLIDYSNVLERGQHVGACYDVRETAKTWAQGISDSRSTFNQ